MNKNRTKKVRILFLLGSASPNKDAIWTRASYFMKYFKKNNYEIAVLGIARMKNIFESGFKIWEGIKILNFIPIFPKDSIISKLINILLTPIFSFLGVIYFKPKIIIVSIPVGEITPGGLIVSKILGCKTILDYRDLWEDHSIERTKSSFSKKILRIIKRFMDRIYKKYDKVITVTPKLKIELGKRGIKSDLIYNGANLEIFYPRDKRKIRNKINLKEKDFVIIYSGGIWSYYRLDCVIDAINLLKKRHIKLKFLVLGQGATLEALKRKSAELGLSDRVIFLGSEIDRNKIAEYISAADIGIIPLDSNPLHNSSLPAKFFEYAACEKPVLITINEDSLMGELVNKYKIGLISKPLKPKMLAEKILFSIKNKDFLRKSGKRARLLIEEQFNREESAKKLQQIIHELI